MPVQRTADGTVSFVPHRYQSGQPLRTIMCRRCAAWCTWQPRPDAAPTGPEGRWAPADGRWHHPDGTLACLDPDTLQPYTDGWRQA